MSLSYQDLVVRDATIEDSPDITKLHSTVSHEGVLTWGSARSESETSEWLNLLIRLRYPCLVVISKTGDALACAAFEPTWDARDDAGSILSAELHIVVAEERRNMGLASHLFDLLRRHPKTQARQIYRVIRSVFSINGAALLLAQFCRLRSLRQFRSVKAVAQKNGVLCDEEYFNKFIAPNPQVQGRGFPDLSLEAKYAPSALSLPLDLHEKRIRDAKMEDLPDMVAILNDAILHIDASLYNTPLEVSEKKDWLAKLLRGGLPCLVAELQGQVIGYCYFSDYSSEFCFSRTLEVSMYVRLDLTRQGIGRDLWLAPMAHPSLKRRRTRTIIAVVHHSNALGSGSVLKLGFVHRISAPQSYYKFGQMQSHSAYQYDLDSTDSIEA